MITILEFLLDIIYPNVCGFCGKINKKFLCDDCEEKFNSLLIYKEKIMKDKYFEKHIYLSKYDGEFRNKILSYKFSDRSYIFKTFASLFLKNEKICEIIRKL